MSYTADVTPTRAAYTVAGGSLSVEDAVRAALSHRPPEARSFGNEDDVEGPRRITTAVDPAP